MANIFAAITAVLLLASAFVAYKNQQAFEKEVEDSKVEKSRLDTSRQRLADLRADRQQTFETRTGIEEETVGLKETQAERESGNAELGRDIASKKKEVSENADKISEIEEQTKKLGEIRDLAGNVERIKTTIAGLEDDKAAKEAELANLLAQKNSTEGTIEGFRKIDEAFSKQQSFFDSARISGIFEPWGFVTINAGNSSGVITNSTLNVVRDGAVVAKLRVRSVESSRASADIIPDSVAEDVTLMVGDEVVPDATVEVAAPEQPAAPAAAGDQPPPPPVEEEEEEEAEPDFDFDL